MKSKHILIYSRSVINTSDLLCSQLPPELRQQEGNMVQVNMEDHRHEDYQPTATKIKPFAGKGHTLGRYKL